MNIDGEKLLEYLNDRIKELRVDYKTGSGVDELKMVAIAMGSGIFKTTKDGQS
tara:strand:- start:365 stop:523 length:159 start_codon:yes stop_codon:yes gene_type:complete